MPGLDTNVLVRWLVDDDSTQTLRTLALLESARAEHEPLFVPVTVVLELEWVLRSRYQYDKATSLEAFSALLESDELVFQNESAVERALHDFRLSAAEFADCLHVGICAASGKAPLLTFDERAARLSNAKSARK
jgi:predicted nucleic-acid-binding protein